MRQLNDKSKQLQPSTPPPKKTKKQHAGEHGGVLFSNPPAALKTGVYLFCHRDISLRRVHTRLLCPQPASVCVCAGFLSLLIKLRFFLLPVCVFAGEKKANRQHCWAERVGFQNHVSANAAVWMFAVLCMQGKERWLEMLTVAGSVMKHWLTVMPLCHIKC